jgi:hypothetical protein
MSECPSICSTSSKFPVNVSHLWHTEKVENSTNKEKDMIFFSLLRSEMISSLETETVMIVWE